MKKWIIGTVVAAVLITGLIILLPERKPRGPEIDLVVQDEPYETTVPEEPLGPEINPTLPDYDPEQGLCRWPTLTDKPWPDWVKFYRKKIVFTRTGKKIDFAYWKDRGWPSGSDHSTPYNIPILMPGGKGLALIRAVDIEEFPSDMSVVIYDWGGNQIGEADDLLGDIPRFDPTGENFLVRYWDQMNGDSGPVRLFLSYGTQYFDFTRADLGRDLHRVLPTLGGNDFSIMDSDFFAFSEKSPGVFGIVVRALVGDRMPLEISYLLVYDTGRRFLGAVLLDYLHSDAIPGLIQRAFAAVPKGKPSPFLAQVQDATTGLIRGNDGLSRFRIPVGQAKVAGLVLGASIVANIEALFGKPSDTCTQSPPEGGKSTLSVEHRWVYLAPDGQGTLTIEFLAQADDPNLQSEDPIYVRSVLVMGRGFEYNSKIEPGDSVRKILEYYGEPSYAGHCDSYFCDNYYIDFILNGDCVVGVHLHSGEKLDLN